jgi:hypothetical protein
MFVIIAYSILPKKQSGTLSTLPKTSQGGSRALLHNDNKQNNNTYPACEKTISLNFSVPSGC